jgi:hypothetical protein
MKTITLFFTTILFIGCKYPKDKISKKVINGEIVESVFIDDSIMNGITKFYDAKGHLTNKIFYRSGIKDGLCIDYFPDSRVRDSSNYTSSLKNGLHYLYDSTGNLIYQGYYFFGRQMGGEFFYKYGKPIAYLFHDFEGKNIYSCKYDSIGMSAYTGELININLYKLSEDETPHYGLFLYLISPPDVKVKYTLMLANKDETGKRTLAEFANERQFVDTSLPILPDGKNYFLFVDYSDSLNHTNKAYLNKLVWQ